MHLILQIGISRDTECVNTVGFPKLGHILFSAVYICKYVMHIEDEEMYMKLFPRNEDDCQEQDEGYIYMKSCVPSGSESNENTD